MAPEAGEDRDSEYECVGCFALAAGDDSQGVEAMDEACIDWRDEQPCRSGMPCLELQIRPQIDAKQKRSRGLKHVSSMFKALSKRLIACFKPGARFYRLHSNAVMSPEAAGAKLCSPWPSQAGTSPF